MNIFLTQYLSVTSCTVSRRAVIDLPRLKLAESKTEFYIDNQTYIKINIKLNNSISNQTCFIFGNKLNNLDYEVFLDVKDYKDEDYKDILEITTNLSAICSFSY